MDSPKKTSFQLPPRVGARTAELKFDSDDFLAGFDFLRTVIKDAPGNRRNLGEIRSTFHGETKHTRGRSGGDVEETLRVATRQFHQLDEVVDVVFQLSVAQLDLRRDVSAFFPHRVHKLLSSSTVTTKNNTVKPGKGQPERIR